MTVCLFHIVHATTTSEQEILPEQEISTLNDNTSPRMR